MFKKIITAILVIIVAGVLLWVFTTDWTIRDNTDIAVSVYGRYYATQQWELSSYNGFRCDEFKEEKKDDGSYLVTLVFKPPNK